MRQLAASLCLATLLGATATPTPFGTPIPGLFDTEFGFSDQLFLTYGVQLGLGERAMLSTGIITPVVGPR